MNLDMNASHPSIVPALSRAARAAALACAASLPFALAACGGGHGGDRGAAVPVSVRPVRTASFAPQIELSGSLTAVRSVTVGAVTAGKVLAAGVRVGDRVVAGQVLAQVDASGSAAALAQAEALAGAASANERAAGAQLAAARSRLQLAQTTAGRMSALYAQGAISRQQHDEALASLAAARAGLEQARAESAASASMAGQAGSGIAAAAAPVRDAAIAAPFDGVVTAKFVQPGAAVGPGSPVVAIEDPSDLELDVAVPYDSVGALADGAAVAVRVDGQSAPVSGRVRAIVPMENPALRSALVKIGIAYRAGLLPGMFARVKIVGAAHAGLAVPPAALVTRAGQSGVFVVAGGTASFLPVGTGISSPSLLEIDAPAARGREVAISNVERLTDGAAVAVVP